MEQLKKRLEKLLGQKPDAPIDESVKRDTKQQTVAIQKRREKVAAAPFVFYQTLVRSTVTWGGTLIVIDSVSIFSV
jgi:hypothetical protein